MHCFYIPLYRICIVSFTWLSYSVLYWKISLRYATKRALESDSGRRVNGSLERTSSGLMYLIYCVLEYWILYSIYYHTYSISLMGEDFFIQNRIMLKLLVKDDASFVCSPVLFVTYWFLVPRMLEFYCVLCPRWEQVYSVPCVKIYLVCKHFKIFTTLS